MKICSNNHEEIIYDSWSCPFCEYIDKAEDMALTIQAEHNAAIDRISDQRDEYLDLLQTYHPELLI